MKLFRVFYAFLFAVFFQSCAPAYLPNVISNPDLQQNGEITIGGYYGSPGIDFNSAFAISNHVGILLGGSFDTSSGKVSHSHGFFEVGAGYFNNKSWNLSWSIYGGIGTGDYSTTTLINDPYLGGKYQTQYEVVRYFFQPSAIYHFHIGEIGLACRMDALHVNGTQDFGPNHRIDHTFPMIEPALNLKLGKRNWRIVFQYGISLHFSNEDFLYLPGIAAVGMQLKLNTKSKK